MNPDRTSTIEELQALIPESKMPSPPPPSKPEAPGATVPGSNGAPTPDEQARLDRMLKGEIVAVRLVA
jgi:hypothetical protein